MTFIELFEIAIVHFCMEYDYRSFLQCILYPTTFSFTVIQELTVPLLEFRNKS